MNGSIVPLRPALRSAACSGGQALGAFRSGHATGDVGSQVSSHPSLRSRISLQARPSRSRGARRRTGPAVSVAGHPGWALTGYRFDSNSGITVTREPETTSVTSSSMTTRQLDAAIDAIRCEPSPPINETL